ncbi:MAG: Wadjet anti-phage system protein JetD domain-containing protein [Streptosporangiaceae bacterium]
MRTPDQVLALIGKRVTANWHLDITSDSTSWPYSFPLGAISGPELETGFASILRLTLDWRGWADKHGLTLTTTSRRVQGTTQSIPTHVTVPDLHTAIGLAGPEWSRRVQRGRDRLATLQTAFHDAKDLPKIVRMVDTYPTADFDLLCAAATWFRNNSASGLTPRQVPIEGLHAKWLNTHRHLVQALSGTDSLDLLPPHPQRVHFTYLDPDHLAEGNRRHDSATVGDTMDPAYLPEIVIISENKDTAIHFPPLTRAVSVEGSGFGGAGAIASLNWVSSASHVIYWGDMDSAGFEIVNLFREKELAVRTILMDLPAFESYERFGTTADVRGNPLGTPTRKALSLLTENEQALYECLTEPEWAHVRRIEQERIPLAIALAAVQEMING